jgi:hypothetical protein
MTTDQSAPADQVVTLTIHGEIAARLQALVDPDPEGMGHSDLAAVIHELIDHAQQGVYRPGAWERSWLCQAFGYDWIDRTEPDTRPDRLSADGRVIFDRPLASTPPRSNR